MQILIEQLIERKTTISKLQFRNRFTTSELVSIDLMSIDNPTADTQTRTNSAVLRVFNKLVDTADNIDLSLQQTIDGISFLVGMGILTQERAEEILAY